MNAFPPVIINDRYRLDASIGSGAMGSVYHAADLLLQREVAVKVLLSAPQPVSDRDSNGARSRLLNEAQSAARLAHPNIVAVYDVGEAEFELPGLGAARRAYLVMQYVDGRPLSDMLAKDVRPSIPQAVDILIQLCAALEAAHAAGIIHRDLKPENVLISADGAARLTDFGLASWLRPGGGPSENAEGEIVGAVFYMAPELAVGRAYDHRADLYSLGVIFYEMLAGRLPFEAAPNAPNDPIAVIAQHLNAPPTPPSTYNPAIPPALEALALRLLSKDPAARPAAASEVAAALQAWSARPTPSSEGAQAFPEPAAPAESAPAITPIERITRGRMVGRLQARQEVGRAWSRALAGQGGVLLVSGEPGIGKTRLVRELAARAEVSGGRAVTGVCYPQSDAPLDPIFQLAAPLTPDELRANTPSPLRGEGAENNIGLAATLQVAANPKNPLSLLPLPEEGGQGGEGLDPRQNQERLFTRLGELFAAASHRAPLLLVIEDAHWADSGSLAFVRRMARLAVELRLLLVLTYREVELADSRPLVSLLTDLNRERLAERVKLARLAPAETAEMLAVMFAANPADLQAAPAFQAFAARVHTETEGNPFFIEELVKALIDEGQISYANGRWNAAGLDEMRLPQSVRLAVQARVERLPEPARDVLRSAAVFGRRFEFDALREVADMDEDALIDALDAAERAQLIAAARPEPGAPLAAAARRPAFTFTHALIPAALVDDMGRLRRQRLHRSAGLALEKLYPQETDAMACRLSRHFLEAGDSERAARYLAALGDQAYAVFAYQEAIDAYEQVAEFLRATGEFEAASRFLMKLGLIYHLIFDFNRSQQAYTAAFNLWQRAAPLPAAAPAPHPLRAQWDTPATLDPTLCGDQTSIEVIHLLFDGLVELTDDLGIRPGVAERWEILDGGRRYRFHLRHDCLWSDGRPVTAGDFEFAWKRALNPALHSPTASLFYGVRGAQAFHTGRENDPARVGIHAVDDWTLEVEMDEPLGYFLHVLATAALPAPRHKLLELGEDWAHPKNLVGNGAFTLVDQRTGRVRLRRRDAYTGAFPGNIQELELLASRKPNALLERYERNEMDIVGAPVESFGRLRFQYAAELRVFPRLLVTYMGFNATQPPLTDRRVRQALVMSLDRADLTGRLLNNVYGLASGGLLPPGMPGHTPGISLPFDPDAARRLLAEAGFPGGQGFPELEYRLMDHDTARRSSGYIAETWLETLGVRARICPMNDLLEINRGSGVWITGWSADYPDPDSFLRVLIENYPTLTAGDEEYQRLVQAARTAVDQAERLRLYQAADRLLIDAAYAAPLSYGQGHLLVKPWVHNYHPHPLRVINPQGVVIVEH